MYSADYSRFDNIDEEEDEARSVPSPSPQHFPQQHRAGCPCCADGGTHEGFDQEAMLRFMVANPAFFASGFPFGVTPGGSFVTPDEAPDEEAAPVRCMLTPAELEASIEGMSVSGLRSFITGSGLSHAGLFEKSELRERAREGLRNPDFKAGPASAFTFTAPAPPKADWMKVAGKKMQEQFGTAPKMPPKSAPPPNTADAAAAASESWADCAAQSQSEIEEMMRKIKVGEAGAGSGGGKYGREGVPYASTSHKIYREAEAPTTEAPPMPPPSTEPSKAEQKRARAQLREAAVDAAAKAFQAAAAKRLAQAERARFKVEAAEEKKLLAAAAKANGSALRRLEDATSVGRSASEVAESHERFELWLATHGPLLEDFVRGQMHEAAVDLAEKGSKFARQFTVLQGTKVQLPSTNLEYRDCAVALAHERPFRVLANSGLFNARETAHLADAADAARRAIDADRRAFEAHEAAAGAGLVESMYEDLQGGGGPRESDVGFMEQHSKKKKDKAATPWTPAPSGGAAGDASAAWRAQQQQNDEARRAQQREDATLARVVAQQQQNEAASLARRQHEAASLARQHEAEASRTRQYEAEMSRARQLSAAAERVSGRPAAGAGSRPGTRDDDLIDELARFVNAQFSEPLPLKELLRAFGRAHPAHAKLALDSLRAALAADGRFAVSNAFGKGDISLVHLKDEHLTKLLDDLYDELASRGGKVTNTPLFLNEFYARMPRHHNPSKVKSTKIAAQIKLDPRFVVQQSKNFGNLQSISIVQDAGAIEAGRQRRAENAAEAQAATRDLRSQKPCRYGRGCQHRSCPFAHPDEVADVTWRPEPASGTSRAQAPYSAGPAMPHSAGPATPSERPAAADIPTDIETTLSNEQVADLALILEEAGCSGALRQLAKHEIERDALFLLEDADFREIGLTLGATLKLRRWVRPNASMHIVGRGPDLF
ncbi:hypothetical protein M885DRAFT_279042 [Pelagophyceae sp. CCMP2097]|nr:hypothetical protein M885DRAFT_279042 [Pelagophyceae sp. CCMP2097]